LLFTWPTTTENYDLETSPSLGPLRVWTTVIAPVQLEGQHHFIALPQPPGQHFYRLRKVNPAP
jgi:hypothetical protein